ncbi:hypothetical protein PoB_000543300 [Plakobranchus ocellatus]|uniref:Uncharacterized protein n=1 Tax=Plakobranchus ocellatus TaxID=259542 RepID=A0AAV3Y913_9GAST|nr:hypothetical protein PoB_000543300 [Plakobranchus ocellatus]
MTARYADQLVKLTLDAWSVPEHHSSQPVMTTLSVLITPHAFTSPLLSACHPAGLTTTADLVQGWYVTIIISVTSEFKVE